MHYVNSMLFSQKKNVNSMFAKIKKKVATLLII